MQLDDNYFDEDEEENLYEVFKQSVVKGRAVPKPRYSSVTAVYKYYYPDSVETYAKYIKNNPDDLKKFEHFLSLEKKFVLRFIESEWKLSHPKEYANYVARRNNSLVVSDGNRNSDNNNISFPALPNYPLPSTVDASIQALHGLGGVVDIINEELSALKNERDKFSASIKEFSEMFRACNALIVEREEKIISLLLDANKSTSSIFDGIQEGTKHISAYHVLKSTPESDELHQATLHSVKKRRRINDYDVIDEQEL